MALKEEEKFDRILGGLGWFSLAFLAVLIALILVRPPFFLNFVDTVLRVLGIHPLWNWLLATIDFLFVRYGIFFVFALIVVFWWIFFRGINEQKEALKKIGKK